MLVLRQIIVYFIGFLLTGILYAIYSYLSDLPFFQIEYGSLEGYKGSLIAYLIFFCIGYALLSLPIFIVYNFMMSSFIGKNKTRLIAGFALGAFIGLAVNRGGYSYYIGDYRGIKTIIVFALTGFSLELIRSLYNKNNKETKI